jgi:hypothetical protein
VIRRLSHKKKVRIGYWSKSRSSLQCNAPDWLMATVGTLRSKSACTRAEGTGTADGLGEGDWVGDGEGVGDDEGDGEGVGDDEGDGDRVGDREGVGDGVAEGTAVARAQAKLPNDSIDRPAPKVVPPDTACVRETRKREEDARAAGRNEPGAGVWMEPAARLPRPSCPELAVELRPT